MYPYDIIENMSKRNIILFIIFILIAILGWAIFSSMQAPTGSNGGNNEDSGGTNFVSEFFNTIRKKQADSVEENTQDSGDEQIGENNTDNNDSAEQNKAKLYKISSMPVAGFTLFKKEIFKEVPEDSIVVNNSKTTKPIAPATDFVTLLRYVAQDNGNIFQTEVAKISERKFSDTVVQNVHEAFFGDNGSSVVMRYLKGDNKTIATFTGTLPKEVLGGDTGGNELVGSFLPENIKNLSVSSNGSNIFYLYTIKDTTAGMVSGFTGVSKTQVFDSQFTEWLSQWPNDNLITLTTKPSGYVPGYMYGIVPSKKDLTKILSGIKGLTTLTSPDGKKVLYSNNFMATSVYNMETKEVLQLKINTLVEKCAWVGDSLTIYCAAPKFANSNAIYPDSWYQGEVSFNDNFWKIDLPTKEETMLLDPFTVPGENEVDVTMLKVDEQKNNLFFINKKDSHLWGLELN